MMICGEPTLPWPDVRWDRLAIVGNLVLEVPDDWTAIARPGVVELARAGSTINLRYVHARGADPAVGFAAVAADDHEALLIEGAPERLTVLRSTGTILDVRYGGVGSTAVRIASRGPIESGRWRCRSSTTCCGRDGRPPRLSDQQRSRRQTASAARAPRAAALRRRGVIVRRRCSRSVGRTDGSSTSCRWRTAGVVPGRVRRSEVGTAARAAGLTGRFGALTSAGAALLRPAHGPEDLLVVESRTRATS